MYENISLIVKQVSSFVWGPVLMIFLLGTGLYFTIRLKRCCDKTYQKL